MHGLRLVEQLTDPARRPEQALAVTLGLFDQVAQVQAALAQARLEVAPLRRAAFTRLIGLGLGARHTAGVKIPQRHLHAQHDAAVVASRSVEKIALVEHAYRRIGEAGRALGGAHGVLTPPSMPAAQRVDSVGG